jgi:hypothetical protein
MSFFPYLKNRYGIKNILTRQLYLVKQTKNKKYSFRTSVVVCIFTKEQANITIDILKK